MEQFELRFWFEHGGTCLWSQNDKARARYGYAVNNLDLPISRALQDELRGLEVRYAQCLDWDCPSNPSPWSDEDRLDFRADAITAYWRLVHALGSAYHVVNDIKACLYDEPDDTPNAGRMNIYDMQTENDAAAISIGNISTSDEDFRSGSPYNTTFDVTVQSGNFTGMGIFEIDIADFCVFAREIHDLYRNLKGKATLNDIGYGSSIEFEVINRRGHIEAHGTIYGNAAEQSMTFTFRIDQTDLQSFAQNLHADFGLFEKYRR